MCGPKFTPVFAPTPASTSPISVVGTRTKGVERRYRLLASPTTSISTPPPIAITGSPRREIPKRSICSATRKTDSIVLTCSCAGRTQTR